jgi:hypothetical protein
VNNFESNSTFLKHPNYFADPFHLNREEADFYTSDYVVKTLKAKIDRVFLGINNTIANQIKLFKLKNLIKILY